MKNEVVNALAVVGSFFFPGLGQAMKGRFIRATLIAFGFICSIALILLVIGIILAPAVWIFAIYDAYHIEVK